MKRNFRRRRLAYEQLESKAAPSSMLMAVPATGTEVEQFFVVPGEYAAGYRYETEQILMFVSENTINGECASRPSTLPTAAQCAAADEMMMKLVPTAGNSLLVLGFYHDGPEL